MPANVKSGLLIATGYTYNSNSEKTSFSVSGEGLQNAEEILYNYAPYSQSGALSIYKCKLTPGKKIAVTFTNTGYGTCSLNVALLHS
ncbi:MAG: hypothetical protein K2I96_04280 [Lachnospiraceae bacterium]|nr:hypothetical protein [Lachnospiraceae bacterium]